MRLRRAARTWRALSRAERRLWLQAWLLLPLLVVALRLFSFRRVQAALLAPAGGSPRHDLPAAQAVAGLVHGAAHWGPIPAACLARSLTLCRLLRGQNLAADLRIGMARSGGHFTAHAWVEHGGVALNDGPDVAARYAAFDRAWLREGGSAQ